MTEQQKINPQFLEADDLQDRLKDPEFCTAWEEESLKVKIAMKVHAQRKAMGLSKMRLAKMAQTSQRVISRIEHAEVSVGVDLLQRIAHALGIRITLTLGSSTGTHIP